MFEPEFIYYEELGEFLEEDFIPKIKRAGIQFAVSDKRAINIILKGTEILAYTFYNSLATIKVKGPRARHRYTADTFHHWNHIFPSEFWQDLALKIEKEFDWPTEFASDWATYMSLWVFKLILPEKSGAFHVFLQEVCDATGAGAGPVTSEEGTAAQEPNYVEDHFSEL